MSIKINDNFSLRAPKPVDDRVGSFSGGQWNFPSTVAAFLANAAITPYRYPSMTVTFMEDGIQNEYWFVGGVADADFKLKLSGVPIDLSNYVNRTTDQTVGGSKTFTDTFNIDISTDIEDYRTDVNVSQYSILLRHIDPGEEPDSRSIQISASDIRISHPEALMVFDDSGLLINTNNSVTLENLAGTGTRIVTASPTGVLGSSVLPNFSSFELSANKQNSLAEDGTGVKYPTVDAVNEGIAGATNPNRYNILNQDIDNVFRSSGTLELLQIQNPTNYSRILRFTPSLSGGQQIAYSPPTIIDPLKTTTIGFWVRNDNIENGLFMTLSYFDASMVNLGGNEEIYISTPDLRILGKTREGGYLDLVVKEIKSGWSFIEIKANPNPTKTAARYYAQNFFLDSNLAGVAYDYAGFVMINDNVSLNPYSNYSVPFNKSINHWVGKRVLWAGDSIFAVNKSQQVAHDELGVIGVNQARSGSCITPGYGYNPTGGESTLELVPDFIALNPDIIYINGGTNDYGYGVPIGTITDTGSTTFYGAYKQMLQELTEGLPNCKIITSTPIYGNINLGIDDVEVYEARKMYSEAIVEVCNLYGVPVLDKFVNSGIGVGNYQSKLADGIHPTDATYKELGIMDKNFIEQSNGATKFSGRGRFSAGAIISGQNYDTYIDNEYANTVNFGYNTNSKTGGWFNYKGYQGGFSHFRDFSIGDGKGNAVVNVDGETKVTTFSGKAVVSTAPTNPTDVVRLSDLSTYAPLASPALTGTPTAPTATAGTNTMQIATTAFVQGAMGGKANLVGGNTFTGGGSQIYIGTSSDFISFNPNAPAFNIQSGTDLRYASMQLTGIYFSTHATSGGYVQLKSDNITTDVQRVQQVQSADGTLALTVQTGDYEVTSSSSGYILKSPDGTRWRITVSDTGVLTPVSL